MTFFFHNYNSVIKDKKLFVKNKYVIAMELQKHNSGDINLILNNLYLFYFLRETHYLKINASSLMARSDIPFIFLLFCHLFFAFYITLIELLYIVLVRSSAVCFFLYFIYFLHNDYGADIWREKKTNKITFAFY